MTIAEKKKRLYSIYETFEKSAQEFIRPSVCKLACAECCSDVGNIDTTTLEGIVVLQKLKKFRPKKRKQFQRLIKENFQTKPFRRRLKCPFLLADNTCAIYRVRPFSCRKLYSLERCGEKGPVMPRAFWDLCESTIRTIQDLDDTGYSGHISYILELLKNNIFRKEYLSGGFYPAAIEDFARHYQLVINRYSRQKQL